MLGGGGARGIAHLGALEAIQHSGIGVDRILGVSMGSLVGGMFAAEPDAEALQARAIEFLESREFAREYKAMLDSAPHLSAREDRAAESDWYGWIQKLIMTSQQIRRLFQSRSFTTNEFLMFAIENLIPDIDVEETKIPLTVLAAELSAGMPVALESGSLRQAILASSSIPGFFPPIECKDMLLCDLGTLNSLPLEIARAYGDDLIIGVDVAGAIEPTSEFGNAIDIMIRMDEIGERMSRRQSTRRDDLIIRPQVQHRAWFDFGDPRRLIKAGRSAARQTLQGGLDPKRGRANHKRSLESA